MDLLLCDFLFPHNSLGEETNYFLLFSAFIKSILQKLGQDDSKIDKGL